MPKLTMRCTYGIGVMLFVAVLPFKTGGCGNTACITVTATDLAQANGVCPSPDTASMRISSNGCTSVTITGNGEVDGTLCCYPVQESSDESCDFNGAMTTGTGTFGGGAGPPIDGCGGGGCGVGGTSSGSTSAGGCSSCQAVLANGASTAVLCGPALPALAELQSCACAEGAACQASCSASLCNLDGGLLPPDPTCRQCLSSPATSGCAAAVASCQAN